MSKKILKISSNQVLKQVFSNSQIANKNAEPQTFMRSISTLRGLEKPCGLFNPFEETFEDNIQDDIFTDMLLENEPNHRENDLSFNENMNPDSDQKLPLKKTSKFAKKVKDVSLTLFKLDQEIDRKFHFHLTLNQLNMKINIPSQPAISALATVKPIENLSSMVPGIQDQSKLTSETEKMFNQFIQEIPSAQLQLDADAQAPNFELLDDHFGTQENFEKLILGCTLLPEMPIAEVDDQSSKDLFQMPVDQDVYATVQADHEYTSTKRKLSWSSLDDSLNDSIASSVFVDSFSSESSQKKTKCQRTRGIYRIDDVTNEEELNNYLERRKKNNISSKVSRANKKKAYIDMDVKCAELDKNNERLKRKIVELEKLNKIIKDMLVEKFTESKP